jgi:hypothetical protein
VQPKEPVRFVSLKDPALNTAPPDEGGSDTTAYKKSLGRDRTGLVFLEEPTEFHVLPLSAPQLKDVQIEGIKAGDAGNVAMCREAFWLGCKAIKPWIRDDDTTGPLPRREWDDQIPLNWMTEIGGYILGLSNMEETDPKS